MSDFDFDSIEKQVKAETQEKNIKEKKAQEEAHEQAAKRFHVSTSTWIIMGVMVLAAILFSAYVLFIM